LKITRSELKAKNSVSEEDIKEAILKHPGPFVTPKRIYRRFSSRTRPDGAAVRQQMVKLQDIGLGSLLQVERSDYFYKALPTVVNADTLATFGVSVAEYTESFSKIDSGLTELQRESASTSHPNGEEYDEYISSQNTED